MLYVFHVDTGTMMTFDINLALESVVSLKLMIEKVCHIPASSQVLLVSGGEVLRPDARVCSYSAGTDTNPIYMFSKNIIESCEPPRSSCDYGVDLDLRDQVETCMSMAATNPNYSTVVACSQLAQQFRELAREHTHVCEKLVHDQHLQQQGWAAVVANMEDVTNDFQERAEDFEQKFEEHLKKKDDYSECLSAFNEDLETLSSIPILPALRLNAASNPFTAFDDLHADSESYSEKHESDDEDSENKLPSLEDGQKEIIGVTIIQTDIQGNNTGSNDGSSKTSSLQGAGGSTASEGDEGIESSREGQGEGISSSSHQPSGRLIRVRGRQSTREALTLLHWITAKENQESLRDIAKYCKNALELFDGSVMSTLRSEVSEAMSSAGQEGMKRIKGLEERLSGLEQLMCEARRIELEQKDLAFSFVQNQQKAANLGDISVLRMLCESHCQQLQSMLKNQQKLRDVRGRCARAKEELAVNLYHRLKWIVYVENRMFETDSRLMFYHRSLARLKRHLAVIGQLHKAPRLFCTAVHEIVRRRTFSQAFLAWASDLARHLLTIHSEEVTRRRTFNALFSGHFLCGLFPGTDDTPPTFATQPPAEFDTRLPRLSQADLQTLAARMPNLTPDIPPYDMSSVTRFFVYRSGNSEKSVELPVVDEKILAVVREAGVDRGFESETDTEEFEKVIQSPMIDRTGSVPSTVAPAPAVPPLAPLAACDVSTLTEVRPQAVPRNPPAKPPRKSILGKETDVPLTPIPEIVSPSRRHDVDCLLSPTFSPTNLTFSSEGTNSFFPQGMPDTFLPSPFEVRNYFSPLEVGTSFSPPGLPPSPSSPTGALGERADFEPAEFYIEESPPTSLHWASSPLESQTLASLLQENLGSQRSEVDSLKEMLSSVSTVCSQSIYILRDELGKLKTETLGNKDALNKHCNDILSAWDKCNFENAVREREILQRLTVDHELELSDIKKTLTQRDEEICSQKLDFINLQNKYTQTVQEMTAKVIDLETIIGTYDESAKEASKRVEELELSKQKSMKELQEKMTHEFKAELESLRSRFRLVALTSMDRSPSESSLEKIERSDMIEIANHKAILLQTKEDMEIEREEAVKFALDKQEEEWKQKIADEFKKNECEKQINLNEAVRRIIDEKERQLDQSRERESILLRECMKYKETIQQLSDPETSDSQSMAFLQARLDTLESEKALLQKELSEKSDLVSTDVKEQQTDNVELKDSATNPDPKSRPKVSKNQLPVSIPTAIFSSTSCNAGDTVLIVWDHDFNNYTIVQDSPTLFLLHIDCLATLDLKQPSRDEMKIHYYIGKVDHKDYCIAVKVLPKKTIRNRYNAPVGSRFYRVKVRPLKPTEILPRDLRFCCEISLLKDKDSSHHKGSITMSASAITGSSGGSSKFRESPMTKSVCMIPITKRSDEVVTEVIVSEEASYCPEEQIRSEQPDSIELNNPNASPANDDQQVPCSQLEMSTMVLNVPEASSRFVQTSTVFTVPPEESVPYEVTKDERINEELISEVAEEAAP